MKSKRGLNNIVSSLSEAKKIRTRLFHYIGRDEYVLRCRSNFVIELLEEKSSLDKVQVSLEIYKCTQTHTHTHTHTHIYIYIYTYIYLSIHINV